MPSITPEDLARFIDAPREPAVFFLSGDADFLREQALSRLVAAYLDPATRDFNLDQLRGGDTSAEELASVLATPPMMAERRVVVVRDAQQLAPTAREVVERVVSAPPPGLALIVSANVPEGSKAKFYDVLTERATAVNFAALAPLDAPGWAMERARSHFGLDLTPEAARALAEAVGPDPGTLAAELGKLASYAGDRKALHIEDVHAVVGTVARQDRWAWFDLVAERRFDEAIRTLPVLLANGESGVGLVIGLSAQLLRVALACAGGQGALERELKPYQRWMARRAAAQARRWTLAELDGAVEALLRTDRLLKSASLTDTQAIEELLLALWGQQTAGRERAA